MSLLSEARAEFARINKNFHTDVERTIRKRIYIDMRRVELYKIHYIVEEIEIKALEVGSFGLAIFSIISLATGQGAQAVLGSALVSIGMAIRLYAKMYAISVRLKRERSKNGRALSIARKAGGVPRDLEFWLASAETIEANLRDSEV